MIDFHSHILPGIDDGSKHTGQSLEMLACEQQQGVEAIVATPHFYAGRDNVGHFIKARAKSLAQLQHAIEAQGQSVPRIFSGAEVYYFGGIGDAAMVSDLCIEDTGILLLEMPFAQWTAAMRVDVEMLVRHQRLTVVLAHIERYIRFQRNRDIWNDIMRLPVYKQMNAGAFLHWNTRRRNLALLEQSGNVLLGSDCHNMDGRKPNLAAGRAVIAEKLGVNVLDEVDVRGRELLFGN